MIDGLRPDGGGWLLLGGALAPIGTSVNFIGAPIEQVLAEIEDLRHRHRDSFDVAEVGPLPGCADVLDPMEAPWTTEMIIDCRRWTAYLNNSIDGGDITAIAPAIARRLNVDLVSAMHSPRYGPGHAATQLWLEGPSGEPPLMYIRTLSAHCQDGRWSWHAGGEIQAFEQPDRYRARRVRDRLDRDLLVKYLDALGIAVDDPAFFGEGAAIRQRVDLNTRSESVESWRAANYTDR